jgi:hypothetical protein
MGHSEINGSHIDESEKVSESEARKQTEVELAHKSPLCGRVDIEGVFRCFAIVLFLLVVGRFDGIGRHMWWQGARSTISPILSGALLIIGGVFAKVLRRQLIGGLADKMFLGTPQDRRPQFKFPGTSDVFLAVSPMVQHASGSRTIASLGPCFYLLGRIATRTFKSARWEDEEKMVTGYSDQNMNGHVFTNKPTLATTQGH